MKNLYLIILTLLSPAFLFSQNFAPINQDTKSLYSVNETGKTFSLSIENMFTANGNSFYATLLILKQIMMSQTHGVHFRQVDQLPIAPYLATR
jgi:hypothetical protein